MSTWRLLDTGALSASVNMAIDEALLQLYARGQSPPTLRFYQWHPPAVSLGYFQRKHSIDLAACGQRGFDVVRRLTGGRAVLHLDDLTYSVIAGIEEGIPFSLAAAYGLLCEGLLAGFRLLGFQAKVGCESARPPQGDVCFMRSAIGDIVFQGKKFVGSAQTWFGSSMLQHGSIILEPQAEAWVEILKARNSSRDTLYEKLNAKMCSLREIAGRRIEPHAVKEALKRGFAQALGAEFRVGELSAEELALAREIISRQTPCEESDDRIEQLLPNTVA